METNKKNILDKIDDSLNDIDDLIELREAIGGAAGLVGKALKQPLKHPIGYGLPAGVGTLAATSPEFKKEVLDDPNTVDQIQKYTDWFGMIPPIGPVPVGDVVDLASAGVDVIQGLGAETEKEKEQQFADASLRALAAIPFAGTFINPITKTGANLIKKTQLPVTAYTFADPIHGGDPFGIKSKSDKDKKTTAKAPEDKKDSTFDDIMNSLADQLSQEDMFTNLQQAPVSTYTRVIEPSGPPKIVSGRKQVTFENHVIDISNDITHILLNEAGRGAATSAAATRLGRLTPENITDLIQDPKLMKQLKKALPFERARGVLRGLLSPSVLALGGIAGLPFYFASRFGAAEEGEAGGKKDGSSSAGLAGTQDVLDKMGVSPFGWIKGFSPSASAISSLAQRAGVRAS